MKGQNLDLSTEPSGKITSGERQANDSKKSTESRSFVGVHFVCCDIYTRVYINKEETAYNGRCPKCGKRVNFRVGSGGSDNRFFTAS